MIYKVLTIAGTDPSGGAGIQADLKTFSALGTYGASVITALVAQNTTGVQAIHSLPASFVTAQIDSVLSDLDIAAVKLGMLERTEIIEAVATALEARPGLPVVVDPVMVAKSGDRLLDESAEAALRSRILPLARIVTPNLPEAGVLLGRSPATSLDEMRVAARDLLALGPQAVLLKGGHLDGGDSVDILMERNGESAEFSASRIATRNSHGTGCTLSAAITALMPQRATLADAVRDAKGYLTEALAQADRLEVGHGHGPVHHFHGWW